MTPRLLPAAALLVLLALAGCDGDEGHGRAARPDHPCDVVTGEEATEVLGEAVTTTRVDDPRLKAVQICSYVPGSQDVDAPFLSLQSTPDDTPLEKLVRIAGRGLESHPVDVPGADAAAAVVDREVSPTVTVFATHDGVVHTVVIGLADAAEAERLGIELAGLLVAGR